VKAFVFTIVILLFAAPSAHACNEGDVEARAIAPFQIYGALNPETPIGAVEAGGTVCIDNNLNLKVPPASDKTWIYYKQGLRMYEDTAPLSALRGMAEP
jgi:hypothetical protein